MRDGELLQRAGQGDETAFLLLYQTHRDTLFRFAYRMIGSVDQAEDVAHDCFLGLLKHPGRFDATRASLRTYLYAATRNLVLKRLRGLGHEVTVEELPDGPDGVGPPGPLQQLLDEELSLTVRNAVSALSPLQREALILFEYDQLALAEIAAIAETDVGTVKARLHRARTRLRTLLAPFYRRGDAISAEDRNYDGSAA